MHTRWYHAYKDLKLPEFLEKINHSRQVTIIKRLSGNDTGLTGTHQAGVYFPRSFFELTLPQICHSRTKNPDVFIPHTWFACQNHLIENLRALYYNNKFTNQGTRDEFRFTGWGGKNCPAQSEENTGSIFVFSLGKPENTMQALGWVTTSLEEENTIESWVGEEISPGEFCLSKKNKKELAPPDSTLTEKIPKRWFYEFPTGLDLFRLVEKIISYDSLKGDIDKLLIKRRNLEFKIFRIIENQSMQPILKKGFKNLDELIKTANSLTNRRKSRTGNSLEYNLESIFNHHQLEFQMQVKTEANKKPDFIFPSARAYHNPEFPSNDLVMLAAKTCCKDRWRQIINEADRIAIKHLFTLQEGVSKNQLREMFDAGVRLVVPQSNLNKFPNHGRFQIQNLKSFVESLQRHKKTPDHSPNLLF